jgi:cytochrome c peroxidase
VIPYPLRLACACMALGAAAAAAAEPPQPFYGSRFETRPTVAAMTRLGRALFFDASLSASGTTSCASCHDPRHAYGPPNALPVQLAGPGGAAHGRRAVPSLKYLQKVAPFTEHFFDSDGDDSVDQGPAGGHTWDGRARTLHEQAALPLLSPLEMANGSSADVVRKVRRGPYAAQLRETFGAHVLDDPQLAFDAVVLSLEVFQQDPAQFYPYDSKYDAYLRQRVQLSDEERRGLELFNDPAKGNCASCHTSAIRNGAFPNFSDWGFIAIGVPRNPAIAANADPRYVDLGLCGPMRTDLADRAEYCGRFRTPSLRNVARRKVFFHNGRVKTLEQAVRFYVERDVTPAKWYPRRKDGSLAMFDDLPPAYRGNVNMEPPFGRKPGDKPVLDATEIRDVVAFLGTLNDGYQMVRVSLDAQWPTGNN